VYSYELEKYEAYFEADLSSKLGPRLQAADLTIGFNIRRFDLPVLQPYLSFPVSSLPVLDIMEEIVKNLGHRVSLESLAQATLGEGKSGSGLDALRWFKEGRFDLITKYCLDDVRLTKALYDYGKQHGRLFATSRFSEERLQIPVFWPERKREMGAITKVLAEAFEKRLQVEIEYLSQSVASGESPQRVRCVDVYSVREPYFEGYCHFRKDVRQFRIDRILDIKPTWQRYTIPPDFMPAATAE
jgi:DEAD/DEAH box helicase domain-containing protein